MLCLWPPGWSSASGGRIRPPYSGAALEADLGSRLSAARALRWRSAWFRGAGLARRAASVAAHASWSGPPPDYAPGDFPRDPHCIAGGVLATPPTAVRLTFTEPIELIRDGIMVVAPSGARVTGGRRGGARDSVRPIVADEPGTYLVAWRITSADTHAEVGPYTSASGRRARASEIYRRGSHRGSASASRSR